MWIIPNILQLSNGAPDTKAFISDLNEQSQICASSLMVRSKPLPARTWSQKWRRDSWTRHLSGRILKPSHAKSFVTEWTCLWPVTPASHSQQPENDSEQKTQDTSGHTLPDQFELFAPDSASLKMSKDTSRWDSPASSATWKNWVTEQRGEYSRRLKSVRHTRESGCSSSQWPTISVNESKNSVGKSQERRNSIPLGTMAAMESGQAAPANPSTAGSHQGLWAAPKASDPQHAGPNMRDSAGNYALPAQAVREQWATPSAACDAGGPVGLGGGSGNRKKMVAMMGEEVGKAMTCGKLNPRWVETLMGLPVGWTMPSCASPVTIAPTNSDFSETESCQQPQSEHLEHFSGGL